MNTIDDEIKNIMIKYVEDNPGCTKDKLVGYMAGYDRKLSNPVNPHSRITRSPVVIWNYLDELTGKEPFDKKPKIVSSPDPKNKQTHCLYINPENLYIQISQILSNIESKILRWNEPIDKLNKLGTSKNQKDKDKALRIKQNCVYAYYDTIGMMLRHFPSQIKGIRFSENDAQTLTEKVMQLNREYSDQVLGIEGFEKSVIQARDHIFETMKKLNVPFKNEAYEYVKPEMLNDLMRTLESFYKQFSV